MSVVPELPIPSNGATAAATTLMLHHSSSPSTHLLLHTMIHLLQQQHSTTTLPLGLLNYLLQRCRQIDTTTRIIGSSSLFPNLERQVLFHHNHHDSGYTLLHDAIYQSDLGRILWLLRLDNHNNGGIIDAVSEPHRFTQRPMDILYHHHHYPPSGANTTTTTTAVMDLVTRTDHEGLTPIQLLTRLQRTELARCRAHLQQHFLLRHPTTGGVQRRRRRTSRSHSWYEDMVRTETQQHDDDALDTDEQNEFHVLSQAISQMPHQQATTNRHYHGNHHQPQKLLPEERNSHNTTYGYEVVTFGRAHHCALGVAVCSSSSSSHRHSKAAPAMTITDSPFRPHRVTALAPRSSDRTTAVAIACATYHTLTITTAGELYVNGLGKGGRLGTGNDKPCATPTLVPFFVGRQMVVAIAAAENHSLCITQPGYVYAFGSNGFGQLGISSSSSSGHAAAAGTDHSRCVPRRVDDLKHVVCVKVAAGLKHSVALSKDGEIYVWGDNSSGQLGIQGYGSVGGGGGSNSGGSSSSNIHKVTRVDTLWNAKPQPKVAIDIAASDQSTMALISGSGQKGFAVNTVYCWGNGNHLPCKAQFELSDTHIINPIAISCAKYHNVALTSNGHVYSWGLHADPLGTQNNKNGTHLRRNRSSSIENDKSKTTGSIGKYSFTTNATTLSLSAPQLVTGMLPENGGGKVVSISASENHTAVLTEDGHLWTWGDTYEQNVLGHEGVRWQPEPKRVPGVHRAVAVAAAKEHTALLIGTSFPPIQPLPVNDDGKTLSTFPTLESLAARTMARHCDLFNVIPMMTIAERTQTKELLQYCKEFVRLNLDGVLNVGQKSAMDNYLNEQLLGSSLEKSNDRYRDDTIHPLVAEVILAGSDDHESFTKDRLCSADKWIQACTALSRQPLVQALVKRIHSKISSEAVAGTIPDKTRSTSESPMSTSTKVRSSSVSFEKYEELTTNMDISTIKLAEAKLVCLTKETRAIRKRLSHISKLENSQDNLIHLSWEEKQKIARRYQLETALKQLEPAIQTVEEKLRSLHLLENHERMMKEEPEKEIPVPVICEHDKSSGEKCESLKFEGNSICTSKSSLRCEICAITCPDSKSFELHMNGRKHRNRMEQVLTDETKQVAESIVEEHNKQLLLQPLDTPFEPKQEKNCAWGPNAKTTIKPKYTLPPPPHPTVDTLVPPPGGSRITLSLQEIMTEEASKAKSKQGTAKTKDVPFLKLPAGCPTTFQSPPWEMTAKFQPMKSSPKQVCLLKSTPKGVVSCASPLPTTSAVTTPKSSFSLADFIPPPPPKATLQKGATSKPMAWTTPNKNPTPTVSLKEIQVQEQDFKLKQDQTFGSPNSNNKWFIEQRERAGSFKEIQGETAKEIEQRLLIEEQKRIEKQIYDDIAAAAATVKTTKKKSKDDKKSMSKKRHSCKQNQKVTSD